MMSRKQTVWMLATLMLCGSLILSPQVRAYFEPAPQSKASDAPELKDLDAGASEVRSVIERYVADRGSLTRSYPVESSPIRAARFKQFYADWLATLGKLNFDTLSQDGKVDYLLLKNQLDHEAQQLEIENKAFAEVAPFVPFAPTITDLAEARRRMEKIEPAKIAATLNEMNKQIAATQRGLEASLRAEPGKIKRPVANRTVSTINTLRNTLRIWFGYYNGYDPMFTWWVEEPYKSVEASLAAYATFMRERAAGVRRAEVVPTMAGGGGPGGGGGGRGGGGGGGFGSGARGSGAVVVRAGDSSDIIGDPIGREALMVDLAHEMIPYTPEELIALGWKELAWCETELKKASRELGFGDDWHKALEAVKNKYVEPGQQPEMIKRLAWEAIDYVEKNQLVTVPPLARESWRMEMMSPERQLVSPFFLGGEVIQVSYPTNTMAHEAKLMSMRGNNPHFSTATVHHELIPGHHLQGFMTVISRSLDQGFANSSGGFGPPELV